ncbi:MAG TPA: AarF/ABC1/UbiB kinase family protein [Solirubrobacteraceae bacterium]|nr:AarF/ABC1/UbiB kinase family protein [Solirubrobacteraceae bacterium]
MGEDALRRIDALIQVGLRLARSAPSGRVLLARIAGAIDLAWVPRPWGDEIVAELASARAAASVPLSRKTIERALRDAWGTRATGELDDLDPDPVAVTPTSQVHRGVLGDAPVAVKVLRPGLARVVRKDLGLLDALLVPLGAAFPALDARATLHEFRGHVLDELDLEQEATAQRRFHRGLHGHPSLMAPAPVMRLARDGVLVSEWVEGVPLCDAPDPDQAAARLVQFALGAASVGIVHADLDPENVLVLPDGRLGILDFGAWCDVDRERVALSAGALDAFLAEDVEAFAAALERLGWLPASHGDRALDLIAQVLDGLAGPGPARLDSDELLAARDRLSERPKAITELILCGALPPHDLWLARSIAQLYGTIARLGATGDWAQLARTALRDGWSTTIR